MAYGAGNITLANFDELIPSKVFKDVAGIMPEEFRSCAEAATIRTARPTKTSVLKGCLSTKPSSTIPRGCSWTCVRSPQTGSTKIGWRIFLAIFRSEGKSVFTPRKTVGRMVDLFEREGPGCFGDPDHTLADLCVKSGMLIIANRQASLQQRSDASAVPR